VIALQSPFAHLGREGPARAPDEGFGMQHLQSTLGVFALLAFAYLISENRRAVDWKSVGVAFAVTVATAVLLLEVPQLKVAFALVGRAADAIGEASRAGTSFVFGYLGGGTLPFDLKRRAPTSSSPSRRCRSCW